MERHEDETHEIDISNIAKVTWKGDFIREEQRKNTTLAIRKKNGEKFVKKMNLVGEETLKLDDEIKYEIAFFEEKDKKSTNWVSIRYTKSLNNEIYSIEANDYIYWEAIQGRDDKGSFGMNLLIVIALAVGIAVFVAVIYNWYLDTGLPPGHSYNIDGYAAKIQESSALFPATDPFYLKMLRNVGKRHMQKITEGNKKDLRPLAFLIAGYSGSDVTMKCFLSKIGHAYTSKKFEIIDSQNYVGNNSKKELDNQIKSCLKGNQKFMIIKNIDRLEFETAQLFMSYADEHSDIADYPQSTILLTTIVPFSCSEDRRKDEEKVEGHFKDSVWKGKNRNMVGALWARVGDGLVLIKPEPDNPCQTEEHSRKE